MNTYTYDSPNLVVDNLYVGDIDDADNLKKLQNLGITHLLTCGNLEMFFPDKFTYRKLSIEDSEYEDISQFFDENYTFISEALKNKGTVLIHWYDTII